MRHQQPAQRVRKSNTVDQLKRATFEVLEERRLLATITGVAFEDLDQDGERDLPGEPGLADQLVYVDANNDGQFQGPSARTYESVHQPPRAITDNGTTDFDLVVSGFTGSIADLNVGLDITHTYDSDLEVSLISPEGTSIVLFSRVGQSGDDFTGTVLDDDDEDAPSIINGAAPFTGTFKPDGDLTAFNGENANGTWKLRIVDMEQDDVGAVNRWSLTIDNGTGASGELSTRTDESGAYALTVGAGTHVVRTVLPANRTLTAPAVGFHSVTLATADSTATADFGSYRPAYGGAGLLDPSFDTDGILTFNEAGVTSDGHAVAVQEDGKILVGGWIANTTGTTDRKFYLARLNLDGTRDTGFGGGTGSVVTDVSAGDDEIRDIAIQEDGKIVVVGRSNGNFGDFAFARYNADGTLDTSFSVDGIMTVDMNPGAGLGDVATGVAIQSDGKIVATGTATGAGSPNFATTRLNADGTLDTGFGTGGRAVLDPLNGVDVASDVMIDRDGKIVVIGAAVPTAAGGGSYRRWTILRYDTDGQLDTTFDSDGRVTQDFGSAATAEAIVQDSDGRYVVGGLINNVWTVARFNSNGSLDTSFGGAGRTTVPSLRGNTQADYGIAIQHDGKIVFGGYHVTEEAEGQFAAARFNADGTLDENFGLDGTVTTGASGAGGRDLVLQNDGKILLVGGGVGGVTLVRYLNDLPDLPSFAVLDPTTGVLTVTGTAGNDPLELSVTGDTLTARLGTESLTFPTASVTSINVLGLAGDDTLTTSLTTPVPATFDGGEGSNSLVVNGGSWAFNADANGMKVRAANDGAVAFNASQHLGELTLEGNAAATLAPGGGKVLRTGAIALSPTSRLDLGDNDLIVDATAETRAAVLAAIIGAIKSSRNGSPRWSGPGITSSTAAGQPLTGLVAMVNPGITPFAGEPVDADDVLVKYTYNGDVNLDGRINSDDYFRIDSGFLAQPASPTYREGDFNYDGLVNSDDYFLIDSAFLGQGTPLSGEPVAALSVSVSAATAADAATSFSVAEEEAPKKVVKRPAGDSVFAQPQRKRATASRRGR